LEEAPPSPEPEGTPDEDVEPGEGGGAADGVAGGSGNPVAAPAPPVPATPQHLSAIRAAIARTLRYPSLARRHGWQGRVVLSFVLLADGRVAALGVQSGSGFKILDEAAVAAVRDAVPLPAPGVDVTVSIPLVFDVTG